MEILTRFRFGVAEANDRREGRMYMRRSLLALVSILVFPLVWVDSGQALTPTQFGDTGLLSQPTADTLNAGNIALGLWGNVSGESGASIVPAAITLGLGTFMEVYGSYPNLLFNDDELASGRGVANLGTKFRVLGKRSSPLKFALDVQARRTVSDDPDFDGLTDYLGRVIGSYKPGRFGFHVNSGYLVADDADGVDFDDQYVFGGGLEFFPAMRLRLIAELEGLTERTDGADGPLEASAGFQYYISPHLTFNIGLGFGLSDASPDWRLLLGLSGSQGIGTYAKSIPKIIEPVPEEAETEGPEPVKVVKIRTLTPLIPRSTVKTSPVAKLEIPVEPNTEEVVVMPAERLVIPQSAAAAALAVAPIGGGVEPVVPSDSMPESKTVSSPPSVPVAQPRAKPAEAIPTDEPLHAVVYRKFRLPELTFSFDQWSLSGEGRKTLSLIADHLRREGKWLILRIDGHTDSIGPNSYNDKLSLKRAVSAATHLVTRDGFDPARIFVRGFGEHSPIADNATPEGRADNRRLELLVLVPKEGGK